ncbi:MAG TPA: acyl-CoA thioesterase II [Saprospiraceae bacterium]|mgnify:CR=1 FL=1|nr:acyl-CoA thioesterase II [Saprospiraceae bacterium]HPQ20533.1 acyl-CoA thioesterase II [Saprospiraceae bacterium]HRX28591.1 acyl-CoA thioesterase II [Saprospiraceae bacterium]
MSLLYPLIEKLNLTPIGDGKFYTSSLFIGSPTVYGGQVLAQSIVAAYNELLGDKYLHSLHGYFLHPGDNELMIEYEVEVIKLGKSFDTIRVKAIQNAKIIFIMAASFHIMEQGIEHQASMPNVPLPDELRSFSEILKEATADKNIEMVGMFADDSPIIVRPVEHYNPFKPGIKPALTHFWFKPNGDYGSNNILNTALMAYASDFGLLTTALRPHNVSFFTQAMKIASLDHAMWFHQKEISNDWHLYVVDSPWADNGRAFCRGNIFDKQGVLVASTTQEGLIRMFGK